MARRRIATCCALVVAAIALAVMGGSCSVGDQRASQPPSTTNRTESASNGIESPAATNRTASPTGTSRTFSARNLVAAEVTLPRSGDLIGPVAGFGALWVRQDHVGTVFRIDATKNELAATIDLGSGCCLSVGEGAVWVTLADKNQLLRIDPASNMVTAVIPVGDLPEFSAVAFGSVWVSNHHGGTVTRIDPATNTPVAEIKIPPPGPGGPLSLGRGGDFMWVGAPVTGKIWRIDPATNLVTGGSRSLAQAATASHPRARPYGWLAAAGMW